MTLLRPMAYRRPWRDIVDSVLKSIISAAVAGESVSLAGFGKFTIKDRPARAGRNAQTGETINLPASKKISFSAAKALKDQLI
ncbi:MAG: family DNA-binding protein [Sphingomonadales bacterium]|nr:family DNA-binding protein [Sphingomonadales bacterium]